jgi:hypothetical protein
MSFTDLGMLVLTVLVLVAVGLPLYQRRQRRAASEEVGPTMADGGQVRTDPGREEQPSQHFPNPED